MARAREVPGFDCDEPFAHAAARVVEVRAVEVFEHSADVLELDRAEPVHDMRVATRRLRTALEVFEPCFPPKRFGKALKQVKELADALGERRDRDVAIEFLGGLVDEVSGADRERLEALIDRLRIEQRDANDELAWAVKPKRLKRLRRRLRELAPPVEVEDR